ncbi:unnamed protein product [Boreogadus saida]
MLWISQRGRGREGSWGPVNAMNPQVDWEEQEEEEEEEEGGVEQRFLHQQRRVVPTGDGGPCSSISQRARPASGERIATLQVYTLLHNVVLLPRQMSQVKPAGSRWSMGPRSS